MGAVHIFGKKEAPVWAPCIFSVKRRLPCGRRACFGYRLGGWAGAKNTSVGRLPSGPGPNFSHESCSRLGAVHIEFAGSSREFAGAPVLGTIFKPEIILKGYQKWDHFWNPAAPALRGLALAFSRNKREV